MRNRTNLGFTLAETSVTLGITGILGLCGLSTLDLGGGLALSGFQVELTGSLDQAFHLARARGSNVSVVMNSPGAQDIIPLQLPRGVKWGSLPGVPLPPGMDPTVKASNTGLAHARITVTPRRTATASAWFLNDGRDVLCMRLSGQGRVQLLRWRAARMKWTRC
ncbi:MAG: hypothetical protein H6Q00_2580 [Holophagaceae bacterium]|nr:hypothetical protein [Holophagaceae bacterium]